ncbi:MAG: hypothetical protein N4A50_05245 [Vallitalea sp.]|nr:hypothetical protein [Vallitalea sp.]
MSQKKYIIILSILLISVLLTGKIRANNCYDFTSVYTYTFDNSKNNDIMEDCRKSYNNYMFDKQSDKDIIIEATKVFQLSDYVLYKGKISSAVYYDIMITMLFPNERETLKEKNIYVNELNTYMIRKKKLGLLISSYEMSTPVIKDSNKEAYILVMNKYADDNEEYIKYNFCKDNEKWYYVDKQTVRAKREKDNE